VLFGGVYPAALWGIGSVAVPGQSSGSLITRATARSQDRA
jgi:K+-transporting ATPase c subunit